MTYKKKLIEVAPPLAVIFAQMVGVPSAHPDIFKMAKTQEKKRQRLFRIVEDLVTWERPTNEALRVSWPSG